MKKLVLYSAMMLLLVSCSKEAVNFDQLQDRNGLFFLANENTPFTGKVISWDNGKISFEGTIKNGLREGSWTYYYPDGKKSMQGNFKNGSKNETWTYWSENGETQNIEVYQEGRLMVNEEKEKPVAKETAAPSEKKAPVTAPSPAAPRKEERSKPAAAPVASTQASATQASAEPAKSAEPPKAKEPEKSKPEGPKPVRWERLDGGGIKYLDGKPYTGPVVKYYMSGGIELEGSFFEGKRSGKWIFYYPDGAIKITKYY